MSRPRIKTGEHPVMSNNTQSIADAAVRKFEDELQLLKMMRRDFRDKYSKAAAFLDLIKQQEDVVIEAIKSAHPLVQKAKMTIGDFKCQRKFSKPCYDDSRGSEILQDHEEGHQFIYEMLQAGVLKVGFKPEATQYIAAHPVLSDLLNEAFVAKKEKTAAVTVPKL